MVKSVLQLKCNCNNYPWGKTGSDSMAARLCARTPGTDFKIEEDKDYAEMWMGTYPELPSYVLETGENLQDVINANVEQLIGKTTYQKFGRDLPFLPKVLSIAKALPLQVHPVSYQVDFVHTRLTQVKEQNSRSRTPSQRPRTIHRSKP
jgi:mannose-6-phosphate isomerase